MSLNASMADWFFKYTSPTTLRLVSTRAASRIPAELPLRLPAGLAFISCKSKLLRLLMDKRGAGRVVGVPGVEIPVEIAVELADVAADAAELKCGSAGVDWVTGVASGGVGVGVWNKEWGKPRVVRAWVARE